VKKQLWAVTALLIPVVSSWAVSVTVNKSGSGNFTNIQAAIDSGASQITITDSGHYVENLEIGSPSTGGPAVTLTSNQSGTNRPVISPNAFKTYINSRRNNQAAGFGLFANNAVISNLIIEGDPDLGVGAMTIVATNVLVEGCLFRIASATSATLAAGNPLLFLGQQGDGSNTLGGRTPGGPDANGCLVRNCEFIGLAADAGALDPTEDNGGYLSRKLGDIPAGYAQCGGYVRIDILTDVGEDVFITFEGCYFHHDFDFGIFPTDLGPGAGSLNIVIKKSRFDANGKFFVRGRGANIFAESSVFTRAGQTHSTDTENSAVAININDSHRPSGSVSNCLFVNCGSASYQRAYFGGVNNDSGVSMAVDRCTFVDCLSGVGAGSGNPPVPATLSVSNSIFHQIGDSVPRAVNKDKVTLTNGSPELIGGLYPAWTNGLSNGANSFVAASKWSAVFNRHLNNSSLITIGNCLVGSIDSEDTRSWDEALTNEVTGCRLFAGYDTNFVGAASVTRATPVFANTDPDAPNAFQLAGGSPGEGLGANLAPILEPRLTVNRDGNQVTISWSQPVWMTGYTLKATPSLTSPVWTPVAGITNFSVNYSATVAIGTGSRFFGVLKE
jgi:hypothetical protein